MQLIELKKMPVEQLIELGEECGIENASRAKRQDIVFGILKSKQLFLTQKVIIEFFTKSIILIH